MDRTITVTQLPSFPAIEGAYDSFFTNNPGDQEREQYTTGLYFLAEENYQFPLFPPSLTFFTTEPSVEQWLKFQNLVAQWRIERGVRSSITEVAICPAYQSIIGMGDASLKFILAQLESEGADPDQWFWALRAITGVDPVRDEDRGNYQRMAASWLQWANANGYAW